MYKGQGLTRTERKGIIGLSLLILIFKGLIALVRLGIDLPVEQPHVPGGAVESDSLSQARVCVELNTADSAELESLKGIGPVLASRIVRYRELLGGFAHKDQLFEVFGLDSSHYSMFSGDICLSDKPFRVLNINESSFKDFLRHPYLEFETVKKICNYRDRNGPLTTPAVLHTAGILADSIWEKLEPYLGVSE